MIGKPEWFTRRKYGGWGLHPKTWQGWVYIAIFILPLALFQSIPIWDNNTRVIFTIVWAAILLIDVFDIMFHLKNDEREKIHEAIAERNAAWFMMIVLVAGVLYYMLRNALEGKIFVEPFLTTALFGGMIVKSISNYVLEKKA